MRKESEMILLRESDIGSQEVKLVFKSGAAIHLWFSTSDGVEEIYVHGCLESIAVSVEPCNSSHGGDNVLPDNVGACYLRLAP